MDNHDSNKRIPEVRVATDSCNCFQSARPVWLAGRQTEMNLLAGFRAIIRRPAGRGPVVIRVAASTRYRAFVNGRLVGHGPARGPHGFYRIDQWEVTTRLSPGHNVVAIEVAGYNVNSYDLLDQPAFVQAEVAAGDRVVAATGGRDARFSGRQLRQRVQKAPRYSYQRTFMEIWRPTPHSNSWRSNPTAAFATEALEIVETKRLLARGVPYPQFASSPPTRHVAKGRVRTGVPVAQPWLDRALKSLGPKYKGYPREQLAVIPCLELQAIRNRRRSSLGQPWQTGQAVAMAADSFHILDLGINRSGFIGMAVTCRAKVRLYVVFDELLTKEGDVNFARLDCVNAVLYELPPGQYELETFEPYTLRYLKLIALDGHCEIRDVHLRQYVNPQAERAWFAASDDRLNRLFAAGRETFAQNAVDLFMDCPSRERAGWLCDSFFTARAEADLCGQSDVERTFYENYLLPARFPNLPAGMLPMCYPADQTNGLFIPNWALWFVVQLEEYLARSGDGAMIEALRRRVLELFEYFKKFLNSDGLLEKLDGWVFVEWSKASDFVQDVNYPSNSLYAGALAAAARLYGLPDLARQAQRVRAVIRRQSFDGEFFVDNAVRKESRLCVTRNRSEVGQYCAFYFDVATPQSHAKLHRRLMEDFGPGRARSGRFAEIHPAAPFIGNVLRLELLSRWGRANQILDESMDYLLYMADRTGTLWEMADENASCNHGFAAHVCHVLLRDVLGIAQIDRVRRVVRLKHDAVKLEWCRGRVPVPGGFVEVDWHRQGRRIIRQVNVPAGYALVE